MSQQDDERNRLTARAARYARVGANVGGVAARIATSFISGRSQPGDAKNAAALAQALGGLKGPLMKVAQLIATIPDVVPPNTRPNCRSCNRKRRPWARPSSTGA